MSFIVTDCVRCGVKHVQHNAVGEKSLGGLDWEVYFVCQACGRGSIYEVQLRGFGGGGAPRSIGDVNMTANKNISVGEPITLGVVEPDIGEEIPDRVASLFREAALSRQSRLFEAAGAMYRKTVDVATKHIYATDDRLKNKKPADALRVRIKSLGEMKILEPDIVELADVAALDGNDAAHDADPYTADEAEALEDLTMDLLDRLFVRPARLAAVKAKQIAAGQRKA